MLCPACMSERMRVEIMSRKGTVHVFCADCGAMSCNYWLARRAGTHPVPVPPNHPQASSGPGDPSRGQPAPPPAVIAGKERTIMHDRFGRELKEQDRVALVATVKSLGPGVEFCNATIRPEENMPPYDNPNVEPTVNAKQLIKLDGPLPQEILGRTFRDTVAGREGVATQIAMTTSGPMRVMLEGLDEVGRPFEWWYDLSRLELEPPAKSQPPTATASHEPGPAPSLN